MSQWETGGQKMGEINLTWKMIFKECKYVPSKNDSETQFTFCFELKSTNS